MENTDKRWERRKEFLTRKNVVFNVHRYVYDSMYAMALALFSSIVLGLIFKTVGTELNYLAGTNEIGSGLIAVGEYAGNLTGVVIGIAVAWTLHAPLFVIASSAAVGQMGAMITWFGVDTPAGPAGAFIAAAIGAEFGKLVFEETKFDHILTPAATLLTGGLAAGVFSPLLGMLLKWMGTAVKEIATWNIVLSSILIAVIMGLFLTMPIISSAAFAMMINLEGLPAGAACIGCCAQMVGFAVCSYKVNGLPGLLAQGIGTSMLQMSNIIRNPWIWVPPTLTAAIAAPIGTCLLHLGNNARGAGMGTSGLVGQISALSDMGMSVANLGMIILAHVMIPAALALLINKILIKKGRIKPEDYMIENRDILRKKGITSS